MMRKLIPLIVLTILTGCVSADTEQEARGCDSNTLAKLRGIETAFNITNGPKLADSERGLRLKAEYEVLKTLCEPNQPLATEEIENNNPSELLVD